MNAATRGALIVGWWLILAALAAFVSNHIKVSGDLRDFMPPAQTDDQKLLMDEIGNGPASQLLLVAIGGAPEEKLAALSTAKAEQLDGGGRVAPFSSRGLAFDGFVKPDLVAPGVGLLTADPGKAEDGTPRYSSVSGSRLRSSPPGASTRRNAWPAARANSIRRASGARCASFAQSTRGSGSWPA